jgi:hypothetical protein
MALAGAGVGIALDQRNQGRARDGARFVVDAAMLADAEEAPVVLHGSDATRFVFLPGAQGEIEVEGTKHSLEALVADGRCRPSSTLAGAYELELRPGGRYRMQVGGLTVLARVVAPGRKVVGGGAHDPARTWAALGAAGAVATLVGAALFASADSGMLAPGNDEDRLALLRDFVQRQQERRPEQPPPNADDQPQGGTGTRAAGTEGAMGSRTAPARNARYAIRNNGHAPQLARTTARDAVAARGIFAALAAPGGAMSGGASGIVTPFGGMFESGTDDRNANGNMTGDSIGDAFGFDGLGRAGTGFGGGGDGQGTIGIGHLATLGHGDGTGGSVGIGRGTRLGPRGSVGPRLTPGRIESVGSLAPEAIRRVVLRNLGQVRHCHEQGLAVNPNLAGRVVVRFVIGDSGTVLGSAVGESNVAVPLVSTCIASAVRRWQFPNPQGGGTVTVTYPFTLEPPVQ